MRAGQRDTWAGIAWGSGAIGAIAYLPYAPHPHPHLPARASQWLTLTLLVALLVAALPPLAHITDALAPAVANTQRMQTTPTNALPLTAPQATPLTTQLPPGLGPVLHAALTADTAADYAPGVVAVAATASEAVQAANPAQQFVTTFGVDGVRVASSNGSGGSAFSLRATDITTTGGSVALVAAVPVIAGARVEYRRGNVTEWYENGQRGLEQGFTLAGPPAAGDGAFTLRLAVTGAAEGETAPLDLIGDSVGIGASRYSGLAVTDAKGVTLPAHLGVTNGVIEIAVDATGATWPVTVDPTITTTIISGDDRHSSDFFGQSVATTTLNGITYIVVGAPVKNNYQGEAYVFAGSAGTYSQRARLLASDGQANNEFGGSVAITPSADGNNVTIVVGACAISYCGNKAYVFEGSGTQYPQQAILSLAAPTADSNPMGFGKSVAVAITTNGKTTVAVGAPDSYYYVNTFQQYAGQGAVYFFEGTGTSYSYVTDFVDAAGSPTTGVGIGASIAFVSNNGTNTLAVGALRGQVGGPSQGEVFVLTGSGTTYTSMLLTMPDGAGPSDNFGLSVALALAHGVNTVVAGAPGKTVNGYNGATGRVYVFTGSGTSYATTQIDNGEANPDNGRFGTAVAVGFAGGNRLIAVGVPSLFNGGEVALFTQNGATYTQSPSLANPAQRGSDNYGTSVALTTAVNGDVTVIGGEVYGTVSGSTDTTSGSGTANVSYWRTSPAAVDIQAISGDLTSTVASSSQTAFDGAPFFLYAKVFGPTYAPAVPVGVTFTFDYAGAAHGVFNPYDPTLAAVHVMTNTSTDGNIDGITPVINVYPSGTTGTFNVTATVDDLPLLTTKFHLTILPAVPAPVLGRMVNGHLANATVPSYFPINPATDPYLVASGSGFTRQSVVYLDCTTSPPSHPQRTSFGNENTLAAYLDHTLLTTAGSYHVCVVNPPGHAGGTDGGQSAGSEIVVLAPVPAPPMSSNALVGASTIVAVSGTNVVLAANVKKSDGTPPNSLITAGIGQLNSAGNLIAQGGGNLVSAGAGNLVSAGAGNLIAQGGGNLIAQGGGNVVAHGGGPSRSASVTGASRTVTPPPPYAGTYTGTTNANGLFLSPPIASNGIPGTYTRTLAVDGIAAPLTYTITNLDPRDGHPAAITALSRTSLMSGGADFTLTITGTGFVSGSVLSFGGVQLVTTVDSATQLHATVPATVLKYPGALDVLVINPDTAGLADGGASLPALFTVLPPPTLTALTPAFGGTGGGGIVTLTGTSFTAGSTVSFGGVAATNVMLASPTTLTVTVPAHGAGVVDVVVTVSGVPLTLVQAYTYATINVQPVKAPTGVPKPGAVSVQPPSAPTGVPIGAGVPTPLPQPMRH